MTRRRGAALLIVLLLSASLAFVALSITEAVRRAGDRASGLRARGEAAWIALGAEQLALATVDAALAANPKRVAASDPWINRPLTLPLDGGGAASVQIVDATRCFNLNSLAPTRSAKGGTEKSPDRALAEFEALVSLAPARSDLPPGLGAVIRDWVDPDGFNEPQGAEDGSYVSLPTPYRTGGGPVSAETELRAMSGVTAKAYAALKPFVCARPDAEPSRLNANMLTLRDVPVLAAVFAGALSTSEAEALVEAIPPGGYATAAEFWANPILKQKAPDAALTSRVGVVSRYLAARIKVDRGGRTLLLTLLLEVSGQGKARVVSRRFGPLE